ncbi:TPA: site-specific integrase [Vibrio parahaemolyticus]
MSIQWFETDGGVPIPVEDGVVQEELFLFMYAMATEPSKRGGTREKATLNNIKWHMKIWFDFLGDQDPVVNFKQATYKGHLEPLKKCLLHDPEDSVTSATYNQYYSTWRSFYDHCEAYHVPTMMKFPANLGVGPKSKRHSTHHDLLAHTRNSSAAACAKDDSTLKDPGMEVTESHTDQVHHFINLNQFAKLASALGEIDPVYKAIAHAMIQTGLRVGGVLQVPSGPCRQNPNWRRAKELTNEGEEYQEFIYIPKGKKGLKKCMFATETMELIHDIYIRQYYEERCNKYKFKHGKEPSNSLLWMNKNGKPIKYHDIQNAFKRASEAIGSKVTSHYLRHTFATYVVLNWFNANGLQASLAATKDVHYAVKDQLGHSSIDSTEVYIRTLLRVKAIAWLPKLIPSLKKKTDENMPLNVQEKINSVFFSRATIDKHKNPS